MENEVKDYSALVKAVLEIQLIQQQILRHQEKYEKHFSDFEEKFNDLFDRLNEEKSERIHSINDSSEKLHARINTILMTILGGSGMLLLGVIMWLIERK